MERRIPIRRHSQLRGKCRMLQTLGAYMTRLCGALFYGKADSDPPPSACRDSATRSRVVGFGGHLFVPQWKPSGLLFARDEAGAADWNPPFHSNDRASCGAPAKMERELHGFLLYRAIYGAAAPPWRGRHGAHFAAPLGFAGAADRNPPFHSNDRASWRPRHDGAQAPRFFAFIGSYMALSRHRGEGATVPIWLRPRFGRWRRIGIRLSIALTGLRGAPATMERKLHGFLHLWSHLWR